MKTKAIDEATLLEALSLNNAHAVELSLQSEASFRKLVARSCFARWTEHQEGLLLAFDQSSDYDNQNFLWFRERYPRFIYVDRVVVRPEHRGRGLARGLYEELFAQARACGQERVGCEVNRVPPNPASDAFHASLGFREVGGATLTYAPKQVRYLMLDLPTALDTIGPR